MDNNNSDMTLNDNEKTQSQENQHPADEAPKRQLPETLDLGQEGEADETPADDTLTDELGSDHPDDLAQDPLGAEQLVASHDVAAEIDAPAAPAGETDASEIELPRARPDHPRGRPDFRGGRGPMHRGPRDRRGPPPVHRLE